MSDKKNGKPAPKNTGNRGSQGNRGQCNASPSKPIQNIKPEDRPKPSPTPNKKK